MLLALAESRVADGFLLEYFWSCCDILYGDPLRREVGAVFFHEILHSAIIDEAVSHPSEHNHHDRHGSATNKGCQDTYDDQRLVATGCKPKLKVGRKSVDN